MAVVATLSPAGFVRNPLEIADFMIAYYFLTQKSQTHFHPGFVKSYQYLIADTAVDDGLAGNIQTFLSDYLATVFTNVQLQVKIAGKDDDENNNEQTITIGCSYSCDGKTYSLATAIELLGTNVKKIYRINEKGLAV